METITRRVRAARRRLLLQRFGTTVSWSLFVCLLLALVGAAVPKLWPLPVATAPWLAAWFAGGATLGLLIAAVLTFLHRPTEVSIAQEIDRRFGLGERLSSSLSLDGATRQTAIGSALMEDAERRVAGIDIGERFALQPRRFGLLPLLPAVLLFALLVIPDASGPGSAEARPAPPPEEVQQVRTAAEQLRRRLEQRRLEAEEKGLAEAADLFDQLAKQADRIGRDAQLDRKDALIALRDLQQELEQRRQEMGAPDTLRKSLSNLGDMQRGPADRVAQAMEKGDFREASRQLSQLAEQLRSETLSDEQREALERQMEQLRDRLEQAAQQHQRAKEELKRQIEQAEREGRDDQAAEMRRQLNKLEQQDQAVERMRQMAECLGAACDAMGQGNQDAAADALGELAAQLDEAAGEMDQLAELESTLGQLADAKNQMNCGSCAGGGCAACQGGGFGQPNQGFGEGNPGDGLGAGPGQGARPEEETETGTYETQVRGRPQQGRAVGGGFAEGPNRKGVSREELKGAIEEALTGEADPLESQVLPRSEREHARQYFDRLREGN